jgi:hypothetical protein
MTQSPPSVRVEPAMSGWSVNEKPPHGRAALLQRINTRAKRLGTATLDLPTTRLIATGHQAQLWHPGILIKDIALSLTAQKLGTQRLHLIVDQDANEAWRLDVPFVDGDELKVKAVLLAYQKTGVPTGSQPPARVSQIQERLVGLDSQLTGVLERALNKLPGCETLAEQIAVVLARLKKTYAGDVPVMMASDLAGLDIYESIVSRMLADAHRCASLYNRAVAEFPGAGMTPMVVGRELVELPMWAVRWNESRQRVFVDLTDSVPMFVYDDGEPIDRETVTLLPRALMLTAVMRGYLCDLFIHGTGGLVYDKVTDAWWNAWAGETLSPMAGVTADVFLALGAPVADRAELDRAVWYRHHLPHNLDRVLGLDGQAAQRKRKILEHMNDDHDKARRRAAFGELHQINRDLAEQHPQAVVSAQQKLHLAQVGVINARTSARRDWCFALYPPENLRQLGPMLAGEPAARGEVQSRA